MTGCIGREQPVDRVLPDPLPEGYECMWSEAMSGQALYCRECYDAPPNVFGMCTGCGSVEVALVEVTGTRDLSGIGESSEYPTGYGCEVCS